MKKIFILILTLLFLNILIVYATEIDVGDEAVNGGSDMAGHTCVTKGNPANATGTIDTLYLWADTDVASGTMEVATFYVVSGNNLSTRDSVTLGAITAGAERTITTDVDSNPIALEVAEGDYIGFYCADDSLEVSGSGYSGMWMKVSTDAIPCTNLSFNSYAGWGVSLNGTGETEEVAGDNAIFFGMNF